MSELLPCPFCGTPPIVTEAGGICCENMDCLAIVGVPNKHFVKSSYEPAKAWNTRSDTALTRIRELELRLEPFARFADRFGPHARENSWQITSNPSGKGNLTMGDCRAARAALSSKDQEKTNG